MTRLERKCLVGSACFHGLTVAIFLATAAFRSAPPPITDMQVLTLVPGMKIVDTPTAGGGSAPALVAPQRSQPVSTPAPPAPPVTHPPPPAPSRPPTPPAPVTRQSDPKPAVSRIAPDPVPKPHTITPTFDKPVTSSSRSSQATESSARTREAAKQAAQEAERERAQEVASITDALKGLESSVRGRATSVGVATLPGEGGGDAFVNYRDAVFNAYFQAWKTPETVAHKLAVADVKIVVARNGDVISSEFVSKSGDPVVDQSVQRALDQVERQKLPPFPPKAVDTIRSFVIRFNLEAKQSAG